MEKKLISSTSRLAFKSVANNVPELQAQATQHELFITLEPLALFSQLTNGGMQPHTILLESAEPSSRKPQRSTLVTSSALSIICRGSL